MLPGTLLPILAGAFRRRDGFATAIVAALVCVVAIPHAAAGLPVLLGLVGVAAGVLVQRTGRAGRP